MLFRYGAVQPLRRKTPQHATRGHYRTIRTLVHYNVIEHTTPCQHTRQYPGGAEPGHHSDLRLSIKQYVPKQEPDKSSATVTVVGAHGNGLPSELLEPFWDDFYEQMRSEGRGIRSIWVADQAHQGRSGLLNERTLGNDPSWFDHARDLLFFINLKQREMPQPLFGIGHSMGASQLAHLALLHPNLLQGLVLMDPVIQTANPGKPYGLASTYRRDLWPSRQSAKESFSKSKFYQAWDPRVFDKWIAAGLRDLPTELHPDDVRSEPGPQVTLATTKAQEVYSYLRPLYKGEPSLPPSENFDQYPDLNREDEEPGYPFYRPEPAILFRRLAELKPPVLYITGKHSPLAEPELNKQRLEATGAGVGGSGGAKRGRVSSKELGCGHFVPMEKTADCARLSAYFINTEAHHWEARKKQFEEQWFQKPRPQRIALDEVWREKIGPKAAR